MIVDSKEYYCTDCSKNITDVWNCGIVDDWYIAEDLRLLNNAYDHQKEETGPGGLRQDEMG
jgi:hypothetical protein